MLEDDKCFGEKENMENREHIKTTRTVSSVE